MQLQTIIMVKNEISVTFAFMLKIADVQPLIKVIYR